MVRARTETHRIALTRTLSPLAQGELDGLCGLYAVVNALRLALSSTRPLSPADTDALFGTGVCLLEERGQLAYATLWGVRRSIWKKLIAAISAEVAVLTQVAVVPHWPLRRLDQVSRHQLFAVIETAIDRGQPVLIALSGTHSHYSVICGYSGQRFTLFDSSRYRWLARSGCGPRKSPLPWRHRIGTRSLAVLEIGS